MLTFERSKWQSLVLAGALAVGCKFATPEQRQPGAGGNGVSGTGGLAGIGGGGTGGGGGAGGHVPNLGGFPGKDGGVDAGVSPPLTDFPADPIIDSSAPANAPSLFDGSTPRAGGAPCITSPIAGTLMPRNWLRPRVELAPAAGENLFEIDLAVAGFAHTLRVFTRNPSTALPADLWNRLRTSVVDQPITVTVRALTTDAAGAVQLAPSAAAQTTFAIAPVEAPGKIVYWALGRRHGDAGRLAEGLRHRRGGRPRRAGAQPGRVAHVVRDLRRLPHRHARRRRRRLLDGAEQLLRRPRRHPPGQHGRASQLRQRRRRCRRSGRCAASRRTRRATGATAIASCCSATPGP